MGPEKHAYLAPGFGGKRFEHGLYNNHNDGPYKMFANPLIGPNIRLLL